MITDRDREVIEKFSILIVSYSGGKDSTVCLRWALETGKPVRAIMADTGNELPETPDYLQYIQRELGVSIEVYKRSDLDHDFFSMVRKRGMWPIPAKCEISRANKVNDFSWYLKVTGTPLDALTILGQRRAESKRRSKLPDYSDFIDSGRAAYRPILDWSSTDVFNFLSEQGIKAHPAYGKGRSRVGCVWCVNSELSDLVRDENLYPERCAKLRELRTSIGLPSVPHGVGQAQLFESPICLFEAVHCE